MALQDASVLGAPGLSSRGSAKRRRKEQIVAVVLGIAAGATILVSLAIVGSLLREAISFISQIDLGQLSELGWFPRRGLFDIRTLLAGTLVVTAVAMAVAAPLGLGAAIYLSEYAKPSSRRILKPILEVLAGVPSVVIGYFAIAVITPDLLRRISSEFAFFNLAAAGLGVGILTLPLVASVAEDAMRAVPSALREASYGLGGRKLATTVRVVLPAAVSGIVAALIVGVSRAVGETMVVAIASGATGGSLFSLDPTEPGQTMTAAMAALGAGTDQVKGADAAFQSLFFVGLLLFFITLLLNMASNRFVRRVQQRY
jgi:phosphate transport system permease protein